MLPEPFMDYELPCKLMVNGISVQSVHIGCGSDSSDGFRILFDDPQIGSICLHDGFELEIREHDSWQPLTLQQLKKTLAARSEFLQAEDMPKASEMLERKLFDRLDDINVPHRRSPRLSELTGHVECVRQVRKVLYEERIPHRVAGTVFVVPSVRRTRIVLSRAGFRPSPIAPAALIDPQTKCPIQLVECRT
jgi:hypothetical protein